MKKLFTMLVVSLCGTMAYAQTGAISVNDVSITKGASTQMEVTVNNAASNTAFQFDLKLPAGVSVKSATMNSGAVTSNAEDTQSRKLLHKLYKESDNVYRFLSYDNANAALTDGKVNITLEATNEAETIEEAIVGSDILVVNGEGTKTTQDNGDVASITVADGVQITITEKSTALATTYVGDDDLDFTNNENLTAYIVTGVDGDGVWLAPISQVPAKTPIYVKSKAKGTFTVAKTKMSNTYFKSFLIGNNTENSVNIDPTGSDDKFFYCGTAGWTPLTKARDIGAHKAYIRVPALPAAKQGENWPIEIKEGYIATSVCANVDLDFSDQTALSAYTVIGYEKGSLWVAPVKIASAGTPLYVKGPVGKYNVTSAAAQINYANMMVGNNTEESISIGNTDGDFSNFYIGKNGITPVGDGKTRSVGEHKSYLQVLTSYIPIATARGNNEGFVLGEKVVEMAKSAIVGEDDGATGINRIATEVDNDVWYNLNGQRIDTPTRKGLYIKNGKKVIVK